MVTLDSIRKELEARLSVDKEIHSVLINADSLDDALEDAAVQLDTRVANLEYEVVEKGFPGIIGLMKKPWQIRVYENPEVVAKKQAQKAKEAASEGEQVEETRIVDRDGMFFIRHFGSQIMLKVTLPEGNGKSVNEREVISNASRDDTVSIDNDTIKRVCRQGSDGEYVLIGEYKHVPAGDALLTVDISHDEMHATITVTAPSLSGADVSGEAIERALSTQGVVAGIDKKKISDFVDNPVYNIPYEVATAIMPVDGRDAFIEYYFETDKTKLKLKEAQNGQVDFKQLNLIQNVIAGQPLAKKNLAERGKGGKTLFGRYLEARNGKDIPVPLGKNVELDKDQQTIIATIAGQVMLSGGKVCVEEIVEYQDIDISTGHVNFNGTVICHGSVEDGYDIKCSGNIEIRGNVGNCHLEADGDIIIGSGVRGRLEGSIKAGGSIWARFIEQATVYAEDSVVVSDSIMNSQVTAMKRIVLTGKRASITGGHLFATEEITAKNIGSNGGTETVLEVGYDPKLKQRLDELQEQQAKLLKQIEENDLNISTLEEMKKVRRMLPLDKQEALENFKNQRDDLSGQNDQVTEEIKTIQSRLRELKVTGKVNASGTVYSGVKVIIRDEREEIKSDCKSTTFYFSEGFMRRGKYDPNASVESMKDPDGYTSH